MGLGLDNYRLYTILAFPHVPNIRVRFLILGSGNPRIRDLYLELGSGNPKTRDGFKRKIGLFQVLGAQKILKCNTEQISVRICFPSAFELWLILVAKVFLILGSGVPSFRVR